MLFSHCICIFPAELSPILRFRKPKPRSNDGMTTHNNNTSDNDDDDNHDQHLLLLNQIKQQLIRHVQQVQHKQALQSSTVSRLERVIDRCVRDQSLHHLINNGAADDDGDNDNINIELLNELKQVFGLCPPITPTTMTGHSHSPAIPADFGVTFGDKLHMKQKIESFLKKLQQKQQEQKRQVVDHDELVSEDDVGGDGDEQGRKRVDSDASTTEEREEQERLIKLYERFTTAMVGNVNARNETMRYSLLSEKSKSAFPDYYRVNDPVVLSDERETLPSPCQFHRLLIDLPKCGEGGMIGCLRTLISLVNHRFGSTLHNVPSKSEVEELIREHEHDFPRRKLYPEPLLRSETSTNGRNADGGDDDIITRSRNDLPFQFLLNHYLPHLYQYKVAWRNDWSTRDKIIRYLKLYFSEKGVNKDTTSTASDADWTSVRLSQFPVVIRRNSKYFFVLGIRYTDCVLRPNVVWDRPNDHLAFWNSFPYFDENGSMAIDKASGNMTDNQSITEKTSNRAVMSDQNMQSNVVHVPYKMWPFNDARSNPFGIVFDERAIDKKTRDDILNGRSGIVQQLLRYNPIQVLSKMNSIISSRNSVPTLMIPLEPPSSKQPRLPISGNPVEVFKSQFFVVLNSEKFKRQLQKDIEDSYQRELAPWKRDIFAPLSLNITDHEDRKTKFWSYNHPEKRSYVYIHVIRQQLCAYFPSLSHLFEQMSDHDIVAIKMYLNSSQFWNMIRTETQDISQAVADDNLNIDSLSLQGQPLLQRAQDVLPIHSRVNRKNPQIIRSLPSLLQGMRFAIEQRRKSKRNFELFLKGLYIPGTDVHNEYIQQKVKKFMEKQRENHSEFLEYVTLFSRLMNGKWKKPFSLPRILMPTTREVIAKFTQSYQPLLRALLMNETERERENDQNKEISLVNHEMGEQTKIVTREGNDSDIKEIVEFVQSLILSDDQTMSSDVTNSLQKRALVLADRYVTHREDILQRAILLLIDLSLSTKKIPSNWKSIVSYFVRKCKLSDTTLKETNELCSTLSRMFEPTRAIPSSNFVLPVQRFEGSKYAVVSPIDAIRLTTIPKMLNGPREQYYDQWRLESIKHYVTSMQACSTPEETSKLWKELDEETRDKLRYILDSLTPVHLNPPVMPLLPNELSSYAEQYFDLHVGDVGKNRRDLYMQQQESTFRSSLYDYCFEGIKHRVIGEHDIHIQNFSLASEADFISVPADNAEKTFDLQLLRLLMKRLMRILRRSGPAVGNARFKVSDEVKLDISELLATISDMPQKGTTSQQETTLLHIAKDIASSCDFSDRWFRSTMDKRTEVEAIETQMDTSLKSSKGSFLLSIDPFISDLVPSEDADFDILQPRKGVPDKPSCESSIHSFVQHQNRAFHVESFPSIGNWERISNHGKVETLRQNRDIGPKGNNNIVTIEEAAFMSNNERPTVYQNQESIPEPPVQMFTHCELLLASGDWCIESNDGDVSLKFDHPDTHPLNRLSSVEQNGIGWMNLDDFIAPGINTKSLGEGGERNAPEYEWVDNFKYFPGKTLDENYRLFMQERATKKHLLNLSFDDHSLNDRKIRQSVPLWNLEFLFLSARPWPEFE